MEVLTIMNYHRVVKVKKDGRVFDFEPSAIKERSNGFYDRWYHKLTDTETGEVVQVGVEATEIMKQYEVVEFNGKRHLADLYKAAVDARYWSSQNPERSARIEMVGYEEALNADLDSIPEEYREEYYQKFHSFVADILSKESRIASAFVTGPAKFNTARNERANSAYDAARKAFEEWREKRKKGIAKAIEAAKPEEQRQAERWEEIQHGIDSTAATIAGIDQEGLPYSRSLFVSSLYGKAERLALNGEKVLLERYIERVKMWNEKLKKPLVTSRHKFWNLMELCEKKTAEAEERSEKDSVEIEKEGYTIIKNFAEDRLQIVFDSKPDSGTIAKLKSNGFRWSPRNSAWQRQLTDNSYYGAWRAVGITPEELRAAK